MTTDDSRTNQTPDRTDTPIDYHADLKQLDTQITTLLETVTTDQTIEADARRTTKRHLRELRAELERAHRQLCPETSWHDRGLTMVRDPMEALAHQSTNESADRSTSDPSHHSADGATNDCPDTGP